jgi:hypothetical protein
VARSWREKYDHSRRWGHSRFESAIFASDFVLLVAGVVVSIAMAAVLTWIAVEH